MARKRISEKPRKTILLVTATETEALYFSQMRKDCRYANMTVVWEPAFKDLEHLITLAGRRRNSENFSTAWVVFGLKDLNITVKDVKHAQPFAEKKKVKLAWNNPSLGLWYLLHLQAPKGFVQDSSLIDSVLAKQFPSYKSDASFLLSEGLDLHFRLYSAKSKAAINAAAYNQMAVASVGLGATNMVAMLNDITEICGLADLTHNQKRLGLNKKNG